MFNIYLMSIDDGDEFNLLKFHKGPQNHNKLYPYEPTHGHAFNSEH